MKSADMLTFLKYMVLNIISLIIFAKKGYDKRMVTFRGAKTSGCKGKRRSPVCIFNWLPPG